MSMSFSRALMVMKTYMPDRPLRLAHTVGTSGRSWLTIIEACLDRRHQRRTLATLDDRLLADIGITRAEAAREAAKPFWR